MKLITIITLDILEEAAAHTEAAEGATEEAVVIEEDMEVVGEAVEGAMLDEVMDMVEGQDQGPEVQEVDMVAVDTLAIVVAIVEVVEAEVVMVALSVGMEDPVEDLEKSMEILVTT